MLNLSRTQVDFRGMSVLVYTRHKSRNMKQSDKRISFSIPPESQEIIDRWINRNTGRLDFGYKFSYKNFLLFVTRSIKSLALLSHSLKNSIFQIGRRCATIQLVNHSYSRLRFRHQS